MLKLYTFYDICTYIQLSNRETIALSIELYCKNTLDPLLGKGALNSTNGLTLSSVPG